MVNLYTSSSKALTETQKGYVAIELESLAVVWAMEKFHHCLYGTHFILEMDQKTTRRNPFKELEPGSTTITENPHTNIPVPFYSAPYSRTNKSISRLFIETRKPKRQHQVAKTIHVQITSQLKATSDTLNQLHTATQEDE